MICNSANLKNRWLLSILLCLCVASVGAQTIDTRAEQQKFVRLAFDDNDEPRSLQIAIVRYQSEQKKGVFVDLIGAVHIGDKSYYAELNQRFSEYDAVLFELVTSAADSLPGRARGSEKQERFDLLSMVQGWMKTGLGLSFQLDEVDYWVDNMVHADMTHQEFKDSMAARGETLFSMFIDLWRSSMQEALKRSSAGSDLDFIKAIFSSNREQALKRMVAHELLNMEGLESAFSKGDGSTLLTERNKKALQILRHELDQGKQSLAIFYGAAHMPDMGKRLINEFGLFPQKVTWVDAWDLSQ